jgi:outer membrane protein assembly factor BamB
MRLTRRTGLAAALFSAAVVVAGCNALRLAQGIRPDAGGWPMDGRTPSRSSVAAGWVVPPLTQVWEADLGAGVGEGSPLAADSFVVVGTLRGEVLVFHAWTGRRLGGASFGEAVPGSPVVDGDFAYIPLSNTDESILAYNLVQGATVWKRSCGEITTSPLLLGNRLYAGTAEGELVCLDAASGAILWRFALPGNRTMKGIRSSPASDGSSIIFGADDGFLYAVDAVTGTQRWRTNTGAPVMAAPAVAEHRVFAGNVAGVFSGVSGDSGTVLWQRDAGAPIYAGAAAADGLVIFGSTGGRVIALRQEDGTTAWEQAAGGVISAAGVISGSCFYVGTLGRTIRALRLADGGLVWKDSLEGRVKTAPVAAHERLLVATDDRVLRAYGSEHR